MKSRQQKIPRSRQPRHKVRRALVGISRISDQFACSARLHRIHAVCIGRSGRGYVRGYVRGCVRGCVRGRPVSTHRTVARMVTSLFSVAHLLMSDTRQCLPTPTLTNLTDHPRTLLPIQPTITSIYILRAIADKRSLHFVFESVAA